MRITYFLVVCLVLFFSGCENKENKIMEANKKELQSKILKESYGAIELVDFSITSYLGGSEYDVLFEGVIEFKEDTYKPYFSYLLGGGFYNPFNNFQVSKKSTLGEASSRTINDFYKKNERVKIRGKSLQLKFETEGDVKYK